MCEDYTVIIHDARPKNPFVDPLIDTPPPLSLTTIRPKIINRSSSPPISPLCSRPSIHPCMSLGSSSRPYVGTNLSPNAPPDACEGDGQLFSFLPLLPLLLFLVRLVLDGHVWVAQQAGLDVLVDAELDADHRHHTHQTHRQSPVEPADALLLDDPQEAVNYSFVRLNRTQRRLCDEACLDGVYGYHDGHHYARRSGAYQEILRVRRISWEDNRVQIPQLLVCDPCEGV
mmetsp:Transcript_15705/g.37485  ORF Transcript_15705/g.37485 Transcript_15705/m.37485 type:complete len:229 (-) Transcript_15705:310-996(-)